MAGAFEATVVSQVDREGVEARVQRRFVGWDCNACPCCGHAFTFEQHVVRCANSPSHYTRVSLPDPSLGEFWGLLGAAMGKAALDAPQHPAGLA
jgi:hypothetical protein